MSISDTIITLLNFYFIIIILRCFLTWFPNVDWDKQPLKGLRAITDPYLNVFRAIIPTAGGIDFSPIVALIVIQVIQQITYNFLKPMGM